jgi:lipoate-protein ligase B
MNRVCHFTYAGLVPYQEAWELQEQLAEEIAHGTRPPTLLLLEHPHTYTFGRSGNVANLLRDENQLAEKGISLHWVDRGGDVTYHGPGQLVGYPLLPLGKPVAQVKSKDGSMHLPQADYIAYLRKLEAALIAAMASLGVTAEQYPGLTGVWVHLQTPDLSSDPSLLASLHPSKIASIGVKVDARGVTRHGFALNVNPDMSYWDGIIACGLEDYRETSLVDLLSPPPTMETVMERVVAAFGEEFAFVMKKETWHHKFAQK